MAIIIDSGIAGRQTLNYICKRQLDKSEQVVEPSLCTSIQGKVG